jgi:type I restriction-modification system DNA methylase subunit
MIDAPRLLKDLQRLLRELEEDLRQRMGEVPQLDAGLREQYQAAKAASRTGDTYEAWREDFLTQVAAAWILGCVFVRFLEDNRLVEPPRLSGPGERRARAQDEHEIYFKDPARRAHSDRDYLLHVFEEMRKLPAAAELFDPKHNPLWAAGLSGDGATKLLQFWQRVDPDTGALDYDFTDPDWNTRFLGDLYQDLSEAARKKYALLQTPEFVEEFILDRTLTPAIEEFGFQEVRLIDPTCGSGHFLLGAFRRLFDLWVRHEPGTNSRALAQRALGQVYGVDLNPYAVAIARFRLLVAALKACDVKSLRREEAPAFHVNVVAGDSLLHGQRLLSAADSLAQGGGRSQALGLGSGAGQLAGRPGIGHAFFAEDLEALDRILGQQYHVVVGNPPYITVKDKAVNQLYRDRYRTCHRQYSLAVPFTERFFELALPGDASEPAGFVGMITANSFMKREFGKKLIEEFLPRVNLTHVIDTSGAYIPGHGTPTVILFGRERSPIGDSVRTVMGIKGEPATPEDAAKGLVWSAIVEQVDRSGSESEWVSVADAARTTFGKHPWSVGGGGATELKEALGDQSEVTIASIVTSIGFYQDTHADEAFVQPKEFVSRFGLQDGFVEQVRGEEVRDWCTDSDEAIFFPYDKTQLTQWSAIPVERRWAWLHALRSTLWARSTFGGGTYRSDGRPWYDYHQFPKDRARTPLSIAFAFVATHNHFVLDRGGKVFNRSAPVIKLPPEASEDDHLALLGLLNSSTACFWMKQVFHSKGGQGINEGIKTEKWEQFNEFTGTGLQRFPVSDEKPRELARELEGLAGERQAHLPGLLMQSPSGTVATLPTRADLGTHRAEAEGLLRRMIALQEELDWRCYTLYGVTEHDLCYREVDGRPLQPPEVQLGERAFEIVMARQMARGELETTWFERHRSKPVTEIPAHWPDDYRRLVERRIALIEQDRNVGLIERPEYKRRWNQEPWEDQERRALKGWLLDRLETAPYWPDVELQTTRRLAGRAGKDREFMQVAELYRGRADFDVSGLVGELMEGEAVPFLPVLRYKPSGLRKREVWERTWALQRQEDAIDAEVEAEFVRSEGEPEDVFRSRLVQAQKERKRAEVGHIPPPPKYRSADFLNSTCWRLRGALDVPKERFVSCPHCSKATDPSLVVGWAGWDHLQQAQALAAYYLAMKERQGWSPERLTPLLAGMLELMPWVKQWHNAPDPNHGGIRMGDYFEDFAAEEARELRLTPEQVRSWTPPAVAGRGRRRREA